MQPIKFGVVGLGRIGLVHSKHFSQEQEMYELVAVCDRELQRVKDLAGEYSCAGYESYEELLKNSEMELVIICTRSLDHADNAAQALAAGKYVLLEKPIAVTTADFEKLQQADKNYPGKLFFLHNHRFEPAFEKIQEIIASGVLGDVQMVKLCRHFPFRRRADWQMILGCGGGQLSCWGPHVIDHAVQYIGAPIKDIWSNLKSVNTPGDADDHVKIILVGDNGIVVDLEISDLVTLPGAYCSVYGNRGSLICEDEKTINLRYADPKFEFPEIKASPSLPPTSGGYGENEIIPWVQETVKVESENNMWVQVEIEIAHHLHDAIRNNIPFPIKNSDAFEVVRITETVKKQNPQFNWL